MPIHPTAIVSGSAEIDASAEIGPYVTIDGPVRVGAGARIMAGAHLCGWTELGENVQVHPHAVVGAAPQDLAYGGQRSWLRIGAGTIVREFCALHRGTEPDSETVIGRDCFLMNHAHVAHNCRLGDRVIMAGHAMLGGRVSVGDRVFLGGNAAVHQFVRIGTLAMIAGNAAVRQDVPPFLTTDAAGHIVTVNVVGLRRADHGPDARRAIKEAFRLLYRSGLPFGAAVERLRALAPAGPVAALLEFVANPSKRGIAGGAAGSDGD